MECEHIPATGYKPVKRTRTKPNRVIINTVGVYHVDKGRVIFVADTSSDKYEFTKNLWPESFPDSEKQSKSTWWAERSKFNIWKF